MTSNSIQQFDFNNQQVRVIADKQGEPWFIAKDVCDILGLDTTHVRRNLDNDEVSDMSNLPNWQVGGISTIVDQSNGGRAPLIVSEAGLYKLIMRSRKDNAKPFQRWVTHEVLPSIRKHGGYVAGQEQLTPEQLVLKSMEYLQSKVAEQQAQLEAQAPKVLFADAVSASNKSILIGELAKILTQNGVKIGQRRMFTWLRSNGYLCKRKGEQWNEPTQWSMEHGWFEIKKTTINNPDGTVRTTRTPKVTPAGQQYFINLFLKNQDTLAIEEMA